MDRVVLATMMLSLVDAQNCTYATTGSPIGVGMCPDTPCVDWIPNGDAHNRCFGCRDCTLGDANDLYCIASYINCASANGACKFSDYDNLDWNGASYVGSFNQLPGPGSTQFADAVIRCDMSNNGLGLCARIDCGAHGSCSGGTCICESGAYTGDRCQDFGAGLAPSASSPS